MKKGLVIIYDPHSLQQFIWYNCTVSKEKKWDALCLPNGYKGTYMTSYCEKTGVFDRVLSDDTDYMHLSLAQKAKVFAKMVGYYIVGQRRRCCKRILNQFVGDIDDYDELVAITDIGFVSGLFALLGKEKTVSYLDDGLGDYMSRSYFGSTYKKTSFTYYQGFLLARMGYSCQGRFYFKPTKYCNKYSACTEAMQYTNYKAMYDFDTSNTDLALYNNILERTYPKIKEIDFDNVDAVFFTDDLDFFSDDFVLYANSYSEFIGENYKNVLLKRHPCDSFAYSFGQAVKVQELDNEIPAELIFSYLEGKKLFFSLFSSVIIFMKAYGYRYSLLYSNAFYEKCLNNKKDAVPFPTMQITKEYCEKFSKGMYSIIEI